MGAREREKRWCRIFKEDEGDENEDNLGEEKAAVTVG